LPERVVRVVQKGEEEYSYVEKIGYTKSAPRRWGIRSDRGRRDRIGSKTGGTGNGTSPFLSNLPKDDKRERSKEQSLKKFSYVPQRLMQ